MRLIASNLNRRNSKKLQQLVACNSVLSCKRQVAAINCMEIASCRRTLRNDNDRSSEKTSPDVTHVTLESPFMYLTDWDAMLSRLNCSALGCSENRLLYIFKASYTCIHVCYCINAEACIANVKQIKAYLIHAWRARLLLWTGYQFLQI